MGLAPKIFIAVLVIVLGVVGYSRLASQPVAISTSPDVMSSTTNEVTAASAIDASGSTDAALDSDLQTLDVQVAAMQSDADTAAAFSDTPVTQTE